MNNFPPFFSVWFEIVLDFGWKNNWKEETWHVLSSKTPKS